MSSRRRVSLNEVNGLTQWPQTKEDQMDWKLEVVIAPVADVERARAFYVDTLGFRQDSDFAPNEHFRVIQVTPPGSACSIVFGTGLGGGVAPGLAQGGAARGRRTSRRPTRSWRSAASPTADRSTSSTGR